MFIAAEILEERAQEEDQILLFACGKVRELRVVSLGGWTIETLEFRRVYLKPIFGLKWIAEFAHGLGNAYVMEAL